MKVICNIVELFNGCKQPAAAIQQSNRLTI